MLPSQSVIANVFASQHPSSRMQRDTTPAAPRPMKRDVFSAWSAVDNVKSEADALGKEVSKEYDIASHKAQAATGHIEPFTGKYYAACIFGGLLACVSIYIIFPVKGLKLMD